MKFDVCIMNTPYSKSLHLDFFNKGLDLLSDTGKMIIIEPSTWLIDLRQNIAEKKSSQMKKYIALKEQIKGHVSKVIIENYNKEFNITNTVPFSITYIDFSKQYNNIDFYRFGEYNKVNSLDDCNLIGNKNIITSIFNKFKNYDIVDNHKYEPNKSHFINGNYYLQIGAIIWTVCGLYNQRPQFAMSNSAYFKHKFGEYFQAFIAPICHKDLNEIENKVCKKAARGGSSKNHRKISDNDAICITGTKEELENWKYYVLNNSLPLFINICLTIDQNNNSLPYVPWLVDKKYTDQEIYDKFGFTEEEIKLIEMTIKKYERYSPWFKRYMCGPSSVSEEELHPKKRKKNKG